MLYFNSTFTFLYGFSIMECYKYLMLNINEPSSRWLIYHSFLLIAATSRQLDFLGIARILILIYTSGSFCFLFLYFLYFLKKCELL